MTTPAIETSDLTKQYGDLPAVDGLDLRVDSGDVFGFLGPNGAGKTTTIDLLLDFIRPTTGSATVLGYDAHEEADRIRDQIGILPDGFDLWHRSSGRRHLEFAIDAKCGTEDVDELLDRVGLTQAEADRRVGEYSKGMLQRLAMAMALAGDPELLILDEPSSGLDPHGIQTMQSIVREEAATGSTVFFSSHILGQVASVCDQVGILDSGELVTVDTIDGLRQRSGVGSSLVLEVSARPEIDLLDIDGVTDVTITADKLMEVTYTDATAKTRVIHSLVESNVDLHDFEINEPTLEDLFDAFTDTRTPRSAGEQEGAE